VRYFLCARRAAFPAPSSATNHGGHRPNETRVFNSGIIPPALSGTRPPYYYAADIRREQGTGDRGTGGREGAGGGAKKREERGEKGETHAAGRHVRMCPDQ